MQAETLNCPMCGAAAANDAVRCLYCSARLATIACPSCFCMMFTGSRHCPHCGALGQHAEVKTEEKRRACPRCRVALGAAEVGALSFRECGRCGGVWVEAAAFERMCSDREQQAAVAGVKVAKSVEANGGAGKVVRYVPCPECGQLMNRTNFARCSGVVVDVCKAHGTWFDRDELQRIVEFIRAGGMSAARAREIEQLAEERRRLRQEQLSAADADSRLGWRDDERHRGSVGLAAKELLKMLID